MVTLQFAVPCNKIMPDDLSFLLSAIIVIP